MKKLLVVGVLILGGLWVCKRTHLCSYASTLWTKGQQAVKNQVPRQFELDRIRHELDKIDNDLSAMLGPLAERKVELKHLQAEVERGAVKHTTMRADLLALTQKVEAGTQQISWNGEELTLPEAKGRLAEEFAFFKTFDANLKSRKELLAAQRQNVRRAEAQVSKMRDQKRRWKSRLDELQANEEYLSLQKVVTPLTTDSTRSADIENTLNTVAHSQETEKVRRNLEQQYLGSGNHAAPGCCPSVNPQEIRTFLGVPGSNSPKVANNK